MSPPDLFTLPGCFEDLQPVLADCLQHHQAWLPIPLRLLLYQALIDERSDPVEHRTDHPSRSAARSIADGLRCFQSAAANKDGELPEERLLLLGEQLIAPGKGVA